MTYQIPPLTCKLNLINNIKETLYKHSKQHAITPYILQSSSNPFRRNKILT